MWIVREDDYFQTTSHQGTMKGILLQQTLQNKKKMACYQNMFLQSIYQRPKSDYQRWFFNAMVWAKVLPEFSSEWSHYKAVLSEKLKRAQCSELVKPSVTSIWCLWKSKDFLVTQEQKSGATTGHRALLEHSFALQYFINDSS